MPSAYRIQRNTAIIFMLAALFLPAIAHANLMWPALYLNEHLFSLWSIIPGLLVEFIAIKLIFSLSFLRAFMIAVTINAVSAILGYILIIPVGFLHELIIGIPLHSILGDGTFGLSGWISNYIVLTLFTTFVEYYAARFIFKLKFNIKSKAFLWFLIANAISVGIGFYVAYLYAGKPSL